MKLLYNTETQQFQPYPRDDDGEVIGLDQIYLVYTVHQDAEPSYDPATHHLVTTQDINHEALTVHNGFAVVANLPPPAPAPTLRSFSLACGRVLWSRIETAVEAIPDEDAKWEAKQYLLKSPRVERNHPIVTSLAAGLELSSAEVDAVFAAAKLIDEAP